MTISYEQIMGIYEPMSTLELITSRGFLIMISILWIPVIIVFGLIILKRKKDGKIIEKRNILKEKVKDVA